MRSERLLTQLHQKRNLNNEGSIEFLYYHNLSAIEYSRDNQKLSTIFESDYYYEKHHAYPVNFPKIYDQSLTGGEVIVLVNGTPIEQYSEDNGYTNYSLLRSGDSDNCLIYKRYKKFNMDGSTSILSLTHEESPNIDVTVIILKKRQEYYKVLRSTMTDTDLATMTSNYGFLCLANDRLHINEDATHKLPNDTFFFFRTYSLKEITSSGVWYLPDEFNDGESVFVRDVLHITPDGKFLCNAKFEGTLPLGIKKPELINDHTIVTEDTVNIKTFVLFNSTESTSLLDIAKDNGLLDPSIFKGVDATKLTFPFHIADNEVLEHFQNTENEEYYNRLMNLKDTDSEFLSGMIEEPKVVHSFLLSEMDYSLNAIKLIEDNMMYSPTSPSVYMSINAPIGYEPVLYVDGLRKPRDNFMWQYKGSRYQICLPVSVLHPITTDWQPFDDFAVNPYERTYAQYERYKDKLVSSHKYERRITFVFEDIETRQEYNYLTTPHRERMVEFPLELDEGNRFKNGQFEMYLNGEYIPPPEVQCIEMDGIKFLEFKRYIPNSSMLTVVIYDENIKKEIVPIPKEASSKLVNMTWAPYAKFNSKVFHKGSLVSDDVYCKHVSPSLTYFRLDTSNSIAYESKNYINLKLVDKVEDNYGMIAYDMERKELNLSSTDAARALNEVGYFSQSALLKGLPAGEYALKGVLKNNPMYQPASWVRVFIRWTNGLGHEITVEKELPTHVYDDYKLEFALEDPVTNIEIGVKCSEDTMNKIYTLFDCVLMRVVDMPDEENALFTVVKTNPLLNKEVVLTEHNLHDALWREVRLKGTVDDWVYLEKSNTDSFINNELEVKAYEKQPSFVGKEVNSYITRVMMESHNADYLKTEMDKKLLKIDWLYAARGEWTDLEYYNLIKDIIKYCIFIGDVELPAIMNERITAKYMRFVDANNRIVIDCSDNKLAYRMFFCRDPEEYALTVEAYNLASGKTESEVERKVLDSVRDNGIPTVKDTFVDSEGNVYVTDTGRYVRPSDGSRDIRPICLLNRPLETVPYIED